MKKFNYRTTVNINDSTMKLGFRGKLPENYNGAKIRVQAIFTQRSLERRFPMDVQIVEDESGDEIWADAQIQLPYVFLNAPRHKVTVIFSVWFGMQEMILDDQPFPVTRELLDRNEKKIRRNAAKFAVSTVGLPVLVGKRFLQEKNLKAALKKANEDVYMFSGYNYSKRQRNTDYFATQYQQFIKKTQINEKNILFLSERLPEEGGNLQRVKEVFLQDPSVTISEFIVEKTVDSLSKKELRKCAHLLARAKVVILEDFYPQLHSLTLRNGTKVVQLWHACGAFKTFGLTRMGKPGGAPQSSKNHRNYDLAPVSSESIRGIYAEAYGITMSKVKALGVPRTDVLFDEDYKELKKKELYQKYPQLVDKKIVLFAPTFRGAGNKDAHYPMDAFDTSRFMEGMEEDVFLILKHHPFVHQQVEIDDLYKERFLDLTGKDHINDLLLISDLLITDYSSSVFEAAILNVPMVFYAFDKQEYIESRDFYCDYDSFAPGFVEEEFVSLRNRVAGLLQEQSNQNKEDVLIHAKRVQFSKDFLSALDGKSTERIVSYIKETFLKQKEIFLSVVSNLRKNS